jgi:hypothetical protein
MEHFAPLKAETRRVLDTVPALIDRTFPLPGRFRSALGGDVAELSRLLTSGRTERSLSYLGRPHLLSAYLRCFLPWNLYRLCRLLPALDIPLAPDDAVTDLGSGPLTLAAALWICRPDLRQTPLEIRCVDRSGPALEAGEKLFAALAGETSRWKIRTIKADIGPRAGVFSLKGKPAALVCAVNLFNETLDHLPHSDGAALRMGAEKAARLLAGLAAPSAPVLVVEPGVPRSGQFISALRDVFAGEKRRPLSPCPHCGPCPFPGGVSASGAGKRRWCHFAFATDDAPKDLRRLSAQAGLPKERAALSFLLAGPETAPRPAAPGPDTVLARVISDAFPVRDKQWGRYCCSEQGLVLLRGEPRAIETTPPGALVSAVLAGGGSRDPKSGALIAALESAE